MKSVCVEQRVEEGKTGLADPGGAVDQCDLAEKCGILVGGELTVDHVGALACLHVDDTAALEADLEPLHDAAVEREGPCQRDSGKRPTLRSVPGPRK